MEQPVIDQEVISKISAPLSRDESGLFSPGNSLSLGNTAGKGYAKPSARLASIMNNRTVEEIQQKIVAASFNKEKAIDAAIYQRALAAIQGDDKAVDFVFDRLEGKATNKTELTGKDGGAIAIATADVTSLLTELSEKIVE